MFLIKTCSLCGRKLRFPIDKGRIMVRCQCGNSFLADPDDPGLFRDSSFDLKAKNTKAKTGVFHIVSSRLKNFDYRKALDSFINTILGWKYRLQNFHLLPANDKKKLIIQILLVLLLIGFVILVFSKLLCQGEAENVII